MRSAFYVVTVYSPGSDTAAPIFDQQEDGMRAAAYAHEEDAQAHCDRLQELFSDYRYNVVGFSYLGVPS